MHTCDKKKSRIVCINEREKKSLIMTKNKSEKFERHV